MSQATMERQASDDGSGNIADWEAREKEVQGIEQGIGRRFIPYEVGKSIGSLAAYGGRSPGTGFIMPRLSEVQLNTRLEPLPDASNS